MQDHLDHLEVRRILAIDHEPNKCPQHSELPLPLLARARASWEVIKDFDHQPSFEAFMARLCSGASFKRELTIIEWVTKQFAEYREQHLQASTLELRRMLADLYAKSSRVRFGRMPREAKGEPAEAECDDAAWLLDTSLSRFLIRRKRRPNWSST